MIRLGGLWSRWRRRIGGSGWIGWRALGVLALLIFGCRLGLAQIGPRYVLALDGRGTAQQAAAPGQLQLAGKGLTLISFQGLRILTLGVDAEAYSREAMAHWPAADLLLLTSADGGRYSGVAPLATLGDLPVILAATPQEEGRTPPLYALQLWQALHLHKGKIRLRVTALPDQPGSEQVGGFMLDMGNGRTSYRLYVSCSMLAAGAAQALAQRLPGADLALLPDRQVPQVLALQGKRVSTPTALTPTGQQFVPVRR